MKAQDYVKSLFKDFEETEALRDFMEEIQSNLEDKTASLQKKGLTEEEAFARASAELGDISVLADELSLKRRQEVYQDAYLGIQRYMNPRRVIAYIFFGTVLVFGIISAIIAYFSTAKYYGMNFSVNSLVPASAALFPFFVVSVAGFTFLGLTQETAASCPMGKIRALWYTLAAGLIAFGIAIFPLIFFAASKDYTPLNGDRFSSFLAEHGLVAALSSEIPFLIPGIGFLVFLCLTEKSRLKPWAKNYAANLTEKIQKSAEFWNNPAKSARFGLFSGAIWIFTTGLFITMGFIIGFRYSWLVFIFATAVQLLVQGLLFKEE